MLFDDFESRNFNNWSIITGNDKWSIDYIQNSYRLGGYVSTPNTGIEVEAGDFSWSNYKYSVDILPIQNQETPSVDRNLVFRATSQRTNLFNLNLPIAYGLHMYSNHMWLQKITPNQIIEPLNTTVDIPANATTKITVEVMENNIKVFINDNINPVFNWTDNDNPILQGKIGLLITTGGSYPTEVWFDNVEVSDLAPTPPPLPNLNVPDIKQYNSLWGEQIYDTANLWSDNPTIARWGCALTSADMILKYYGFNINPGELNAWLINQPDGYIRNGLLNWLSISRYTKTHLSGTQKALEFTRLVNTNQNLIELLKDNRPGILELPGHFVVAKSQTQTSFGINDPAHSDRLILDSYGNSFAAIESYKPSNTDLSYIMLVINPEFDIKVTNTNNEEVGEIYIQNPLIDDTDDLQISGSLLKIYTLPKPDNGEYKVEISGNGDYLLDSYLYDPQGNVNLVKTSGLVSENNNDQYEITISQNSNLMKPIINTSSILNDWNMLGLPNQNIPTLINNSNKHINKGNILAAKSNLTGALNYLQENTPNLINDLDSQILQSEIQAYSDSI